MERIRFAVVGSGWRALFYVRAARNLPERFALTGVLCYSAEKAEAFQRTYGVPAFGSLEALLATEPEFVVSCVKKTGVSEMTTALLLRGMPALSETPFGLTEDALVALYETGKRTGVPLAVAEQYALYPGHQARRALIERGLIGPVHSCALSVAHDYHAVSLLRAFLGEETQPVAIRAMQTETPIVVTGGRGGMITDGRMGGELRKLAQIVYGDGRLGLYDFSGTQYHSLIRTSHLRILGERGEIFDDEARFIGAGGVPRCESLCYERDMATQALRSIRFGGELLWRNPYEHAPHMSEDELAVCAVLEGMAALVREGREAAPIRWGMRDAYYACLIDEAARTGKTVAGRPMPWDEE